MKKCVQIINYYNAFIPKYLFSFVSHIEKITNVVCLVEIGGCTMHMCLLGYYCMLVGTHHKIHREIFTICFIYFLYKLTNLSQEWNQDSKEGIVTYVIILISVTFNIFIFCYIGEILSEQVIVISVII